MGSKLYVGNLSYDVTGSDLQSRDAIESEGWHDYRIQRVVYSEHWFEQPISLRTIGAFSDQFERARAY